MHRQGFPSLSPLPSVSRDVSTSLTRLDETHVHFETFSVTEPGRREDYSFCYSYFWSQKRQRCRNIFMILCVIYVVYSVVRTTKLYFKHETGAAVVVDKLMLLNQSLPGVTICNRNLISKEKALEPHNVPGFSDMLDMFKSNSIKLGDVYNVKEESETDAKTDKSLQQGNNATELLTDEQEEELNDQEENPKSKDSNWRKRKKIEIGIYEDFMSAYYGKLPVYRQIRDGPDPTKFLIHLTCNQKDWPELDPKGNIRPSKFDCSTKRSIHTAQGKGNCITLFHEAALTSSSASSPSLEDPLLSLGQSLDWMSNSKLAPVQLGREKEFVPLELVKLVLDFGPENYTDLRKDPGGEIMFHDNRTIPLEASLSYRMKPGKAYMFLLRKSTTLSLPSPYDTHCTDYYGENWMKYQKGEAMLTEVNKSVPLSRTHCIEQCVLRKVIPVSKCWPKQIPFVASSLSFRGEADNKETLESRGNLLWCHRQKSDHAGKKKVFDQYVVANRECADECGKDCLRDYYETVFQEVPWPSKERIWVQDSVISRNQLKELKRCCAFVSIRYQTKDVQIHQIHAKMDLVEYLAEVGGTISMWIGISVISIYDLLEVVSDFIMRKYIKDSSRQRLQPSLRSINEY